MHDCPTLTSSGAPVAIAASPSRERDCPPQGKVAYIMSRFPELTQTFVLFEMLAVERQGVSLEIYPLLRGGTQTKHKDGASVWRKFRNLRVAATNCWSE